MLISLQEAVARYRAEPGSYPGVYEGYRRSAAELGTASFGNHRVPAVKSGLRWMVDEADLEAVLVLVRKENGHLQQMTSDYAARILHPGTVKIDGGGYRNAGQFHSSWSHIGIYHGHNGFWRCNTCWEAAETMRGGEECHICRDWGSCNKDCTLRGIFCSNCGTRMTLQSRGN